MQTRPGRSNPGVSPRCAVRVAARGSTLCAALLTAVGFLLTACDARRDAPAPTSFVADPVTVVAAGAAPLLIDVRPQAEFEREHIRGSVWLNRAEWVAAAAAGMEDRADWAERIGRAGIDGRAPVVICDGGEMTEAARIWFLLQTHGMRNVRIANGGYPALRGSAGADRLVAGPPQAVEPRRFEPPAAEKRGAVGLAKKGDVKSVAEAAGGRDGPSAARPQVWDARTRGEFEGADLRINPRGGHVPGAVHLPHSDLLDERGMLRPGAELRRMMLGAGFDPGRPIIAHCQSGGRSALAALAAVEAGFGEVSNYYGSFSEWSRDESCPVERAGGDSGSAPAAGAAGSGGASSSGASAAAPEPRRDSEWKQTFDRLWSEALGAEAAQEWRRAAEAYEHLAALTPTECLVRYNLARMYGYLDDARPALNALAEAVEYGWCDGIAIVRDPAFARLHGDRDFARVLRRASEVSDERQLVYVPPTLDRSKPAALLIAFHDRGGNPQGFLPMWRAAADSVGYVVVVMRGCTPLASCGAFTWDVAPPAADGSPGTPVGIDTTGATKAVDVAVAMARQHVTVDDERIVLAGVGQGAAAAVITAISGGRKYAGALLWSLDLPDFDQLRIATEQPESLRVVLFSGELDRRRAISERVADELGQSGVNARFTDVPQAGSEQPQDWAKRQMEALRFILRIE
ncbi:MAG: sulfurtransferase [Phycisphaerales bacterium]|nr:sulfurtransferase [Phycisphaerales bacterium]